MSCDRAESVDVEAFLIDAGSEGQAAFRAHYPGCPDCSAAVARWSAFDLALRSSIRPDGAPLTAHPSLEGLERLADSPDSQEDEDIMTRTHVERCGPCRTELNALLRFDPTMLAQAALAGSGSLSTNKTGTDLETNEDDSVLSPLQGFFEWLSETLSLQPTALAAVAIALVVGFGVWLSGGMDDPTESPSTAPRIADAPSPIAPTLEIAADESGSDSGTLAATDPGEGTAGFEETRALVAEEVASEDVEPIPIEVVEPEARSAPQQIAQANEAIRPVDKPAPRPVDERTNATPSEGEAGMREEILLAALTDLPPPIYEAPPGLDSVGWAEQFGPVRGSGLPSLVSQAPDHVGLTMSSAPTLWWSLDMATDLPIQITVVDDEAIEPILRIDLPGPHAAGLHSISLGEHGVELQPDLRYRWFVTMVVDRNRPSRNPVSGGSIRVVPESDARRIAGEGSVGAEQGHLLARNGLWYDAYDFFAALSVAHPEMPTLDRYRERMMEMATARRPAE